MKFRIGVTRSRIADNGTVFNVLRGDDVLEVDIPDDGTEFLAAIWISDEAGDTLLRLPLALAPGLADPAG